MKRRELVRTLGLGAGITLLGPALGRWIAEARGQPTERRLLFVLSDGNGWAPQSGPRSGLLDVVSRSELDWDLPDMLAPLAPLRARTTILKDLYNPHGRNLHGNGWATLSVAATDGRNPGGRSIDRHVALELGRDDPFPSVALGIATREGGAAPSTSADGLRRPFPAIASPRDAFEMLFGGARDASARIAEDRSVLDGLASEVRAVRGGLASAERTKLDQLLESLRGLERQLVAREAALAGRDAPSLPAGELDRAGLRADTIRAHVDVAALALAFGLTHVVHLSLLGFDAHNAGWGFLGYEGDAHEQVAHVGSGYDGPRAEAAYRAIIAFKAGELAHLFSRLAAERAGDGTLADRAVAVWVNSGGGKHHDGTATIPVVVVGDAGGALRSGIYRRYPQNEVCTSELFLSLAVALGSPATVFGDPAHCAAPLADVLA